MATTVDGRRTHSRRVFWKHVRRFIPSVAAATRNRFITAPLDAIDYVVTLLISDVTREVADLLTEGRPLLKEDVAQLRRLFTILAKPENKKFLDQTLDTLPGMLSKQTRIGVFGSWYNYYLCEFQGGIVLPSQIMDALPETARKYMAQFTMVSKAERCKQ